MEDDEPDVMFVKEERSEQDRNDGGALSLQDGFVESSTDVCGASSSPAQITVALGTDETVANRLQEQMTVPKPPTDMEINIQSVVGSQPALPLHSHDLVLRHGALEEWDVPETQSHHQGAAESDDISTSNHNGERRKRASSLETPGANSTLYGRGGEPETSLPRWVTGGPGGSQPSCSYILDDEPECVLVPPVRGVQKGHDRVAFGVEADWSQGQHFNPKISMDPRTLTHGASLAGLELSKIRGKRKCYVCRYCSKAFTGQSNLEAHLRIHTGEKPFKCEICGKLFTEAGNLKKHQRVHTGEKPFVCNRCGKRFAWICNLRTHQQSASCGGP